MLDRWTALVRRLVPEALRAEAFDPAAADLLCDWVERRAGSRGTSRLVLASRMLSLALECRRLHVVGLAVRSPEGSRGAAFWADVRDAFRGLSRAPSLALVVVFILAVGIGANVAVFSFANAYLLAPLPVDRPDRLVRVYGRTASRQFDTVSYPDYRDARDALRTMALAAHAETEVRVGAASAGLIATTELVSGNFFEVMRVKPRLGRLITPADDLVEGAHPVAVLGETLWRSRFSGDPALIGRTVALNGAAFEVIGIAPAEFRGAASAYAVSDVWVPLAMHQQVRPRGTARDNRNWGWLSMVGRLSDAATMAVATADADRVAAQLNQGVAPADAFALDVLPASALPEGDRRSAMRVLGVGGGLTALVLLAACANLAGLMQSRLLGRGREFAVRRALGAAPARLVRMLFLEAMMLAVVAGVAGLAGGRVAAAFIQRWKPPAELVGDVSFETVLDWRVLAFAVGLTVLCAAAFGVLPSLAARRVSSSSLLKADGATSTGGVRVARLRRGAIGIQVAVAVILLLAGGLLLRSALRLSRVDVGFETANLAVFALDLRVGRVPAADGPRLVNDALARVLHVPGVDAAAIASTLPLGVDKNRTRVRIPGSPAPDGASGVAVPYARVSRTYFETMGIELRQGDVWRGSLDVRSGKVVVNETMARRYWGGRDPVGSSLEIVGDGPFTVVGIVRDSVYYELGETPRPFMYVPAETAFPQSMAMIVRTTVPAEGILRQIEREIAAVDERLAPSKSAPFEDLRSVPLYPARAFATIAMTFGALALVMTAVGLYGVVAGAVALRTREFGVRLALGARSVQIQRGVLRDAITLAAIGGTLGLVAGYFASGALRAWLFGVGTFEPATYAAVAGIVLAVTVAAAWLPARRAARIDPIAALRS